MGQGKEADKIQKKGAVMDKNSFLQGSHLKKLTDKVELGLDWDWT